MLSLEFITIPWFVMLNGWGFASCTVPLIFLINALLFGGVKYSAITPSTTNSSTPNAENAVFAGWVSEVKSEVHPNDFSLSVSLKSDVLRRLGSRYAPNTVVESITNLFALISSTSFAISLNWSSSLSSTISLSFAKSIPIL